MFRPQPRSPGFESKIRSRQNGIIFLNAVTPVHLAEINIGSKPRSCDLAIPAGVEGWEFYPPVCVRNDLCHILRDTAGVV